MKTCTYKSILRDINQLIVSTIDMRNLCNKQTQRKTSFNTKNLLGKKLRKCNQIERIALQIKLLHTSQLWEEGTISSSFFPVNISIPTKWHLAWPCLPVLEVETSTTCHKKHTGYISSRNHYNISSSLKSK